MTDGQATQAPADGGDDSAASGNGDPWPAFKGNDIEPGPTDWPLDAGDTVVSDDEGPIAVVNDGSAPIAVPEKHDGNAMASAVAAFVAYGTDANSDMATLNWGFVGTSADDTDQATHEAAAFIRANPDAPAEAIPVHLGLKKLAKPQADDARALLAWRVFGFTLKELDAFDRAAKAAMRPAEPQASGFPGELAMTPQKDPFAPGGFSALRR